MMNVGINKRGTRWRPWHDVDFLNQYGISTAQSQKLAQTHGFNSNFNLHDALNEALWRYNKRINKPSAADAIRATNKELNSLIKSDSFTTETSNTITNLALASSRPITISELQSDKHLRKSLARIALGRATKPQIGRSSKNQSPKTIKSGKGGRYKDWPLRSLMASLAGIYTEGTGKSISISGPSKQAKQPLRGKTYDFVLDVCHGCAVRVSNSIIREELLRMKKYYS